MTQAHHGDVGTRPCQVPAAEGRASGAQLHARMPNKRFCLPHRSRAEQPWARARNCRAKPEFAQRNLGSHSETALPARAGRPDPAEQVQVKEQGDDEYQAPPASRSAEHNDDGGDPKCQQQTDRKG